MPSPFLTLKERERLTCFPEEIPQWDLTTYFTLTKHDGSLIDTYQGDANRLGAALQLCAVRYLGFCPADLHTASSDVIAFLARQLQVDPDALQDCGLAPYQGRRWDGLHRHLALGMLAYSFLACQRWTPADPAGFSPLRGAPVVPRGPSPGPPVALPGCGVMAHRDQSNCSLPPHAELTK